MQAETLEHIKRRALEITAIIENKRGPYAAEIIPDTSARWHAITTGPTAHTKAAKHLIDRGFGIYIPTFERSWIARGKPRTARVPLFPGHIFLFVWDVLRHWRRIKACPGVVGILTVDGRPVTVDDHAIDRMQAIEHSGMVMPTEPIKRKRRKKNRWIDALETEDSTFQPTISTKSYWAGIEQLDDAARNGLLYKALGLTEEVSQ